MVINYEIISLFMGFPVFIYFLLKVVGVFFLLKLLIKHQCFVNSYELLVEFVK